MLEKKNMSHSSKRRKHNYDNNQEGGCDQVGGARPKRVKRAPNHYNLFMKKEMARLKRAYPNMCQTDILRQAASYWSGGGIIDPIAAPIGAAPGSRPHTRPGAAPRTPVRLLRRQQVSPTSTVRSSASDNMDLFASRDDEKASSEYSVSPRGIPPGAMLSTPGRRSRSTSLARSRSPSLSAPRSRTLSPRKMGINWDTPPIVRRRSISRQSLSSARRSLNFGPYPRASTPVLGWQKKK